MRRTVRPWPVVMTVEGLNIERFVRAAGEQHIRMTGMRREGARRLSAYIQENQLPLLQDVAVSGGWKMTVGRRKGIGRVIDWLHARWLFAAAILIAGIALIAASQVMWAVQIEAGGVYEAELRTALNEMGIVPPMLRSRVNIGELRDALEWRYPRIAWIECGWRGTTLVIRPVEGVLPRADADADGSCDVVAVRDGVVKTIVTRAGTPVVEVGEIVRAGDVLIKGEERTSEGAVKPVAARGSIMARVWQGATVSVPAMETETNYTGREEIVWTVSTPWFDLWKVGECPYREYDISVSETMLCGIFLPVKLRVERRMEADITRKMRDLEKVKAEAYDAAVRKLHEKLGAEESLIDIWGNCSMIDAENIVSVAIGEMLIEIGKQVPASGMAAPGQTDADSEPR